MTTFLSITPPAEKGLALSLPDNDQGVIAADIFLRNWVDDLPLDDLLAPGQRRAPAGSLYDSSFKKLRESQRAQKLTSFSIGGSDATIWRFFDDTACLSFRDPTSGINTIFPSPFLLDTSGKKDLKSELRAWRDIHDQLPNLHLADELNPLKNLAVPTWLPFTLITDEDRTFLRKFAKNFLISLPTFFPELPAGKIYTIEIGSRGIRRDGSVLSLDVSFGTKYTPTSNAAPRKMVIEEVEELLSSYLSDPDFPVPAERQVSLSPLNSVENGFSQERLHESGLLASAYLEGDTVPTAHECIEALGYLEQLKEKGEPA